MRTQLLLLLSLAIFQSPIAESKELRWTHFGLRPLGMGNVFVSIADDYNALFYNPAGLARLEDWEGELLNPSFELAQRTQTLFSKLNKLRTGGSESSLSTTLSLIKELSGKTQHAAFGLTPHLIFPGWGFGLGLYTNLDTLTHSNITIEMDAQTTLLLPVSLAWNFFEQRLSVGASLKLVASSGIDDTFSIDSLSLLTKDSSGENKKKFKKMLHSGGGVGVDVGMLFTPIKPMQPTLGISITDLGGTALHSTDPSLKTPKLRLASVNTGFSMIPWKDNVMYLLTAIEAHAINQPVHYSHKLNLGLEWGYSKLLKIQTGLKDGYLTAGVQLDLTLLKLRFATYAVDHGAIVGLDSNLVERRYALQVKLLI